MGLKNLSIITIIFTFLLLVLGGIVHNTGSSLACPDWPLCHGQLFPEMVGGVLIEHSHRLLASFVGILTICLNFIVFRNSKYKPFRWISMTLLFLVIFQGILGGITVIYKLPTEISTAHLSFATIFFGLLIYFHHKISNNKIIKVKNSILLPGIFSSLILLYLQMILGAFIRHSGAGLSCGTGWKNVIKCFDVNSWESSFWQSLSSMGQLHMLHRFFAVVVTLFIIFFSIYGIYVAVKNKYSKKIIFYFLVSIISVIFQVILGMYTVATGLSIIPTTLHLAVAAILFASLFKVSLELNLFSYFKSNNKNSSLLLNIIELTKPRLSILVMITFIAGALMAPASIDLSKLAISFVLVLMIVMGACALNCFMEIKVDAMMNRTKSRVLPSGKLSKEVALMFGIFLFSVSIPLCFFLVNIKTGVLGLVSAIIYLIAYTPMKIKSELSLYIGAVSGAIPPVMGWTSVTSSIDAMSWILFFLLFIWQIPHFLSISLYHSRDYINAGVKIYPSSKGFMYTKVLMLLSSLFLVILSITPLLLTHFNHLYILCVAILGVVFISIFIMGFFIKLEQVREWARKCFYGTILYLPILLCFMIVFKL